MVDINPGYSPCSRILRDLDNGISAAHTSKGKSNSGSKSNGTILNFFGPNPIVPPQPRPPPKAIMSAGKASGKRTLAEVMDRDVTAKKKRKTPASAPTSPATSSKFFAALEGSGIRRKSFGTAIKSCADESCARLEKENPASEDEVESAHDGDSLVVHGYADSEVEECISSIVEQEDGYISPTPSMSRGENDFSSPVQTSSRPFVDCDDSDFGVDPVSSPPAAVSLFRPQRLPQSPSLVRADSLDKVLVHASPDNNPLVMKSGFVDLKDCFGHESWSEIDSGEESVTPPYPSPLTPDELTQTYASRMDQSEELEPKDPREEELRANALRTQVVAAGWRNRWAHDSSHIKNEQSFLKRRETNITPTGRHRLLHSASIIAPRHKVKTLSSRKSLTLSEDNWANNNLKGNSNAKTLGFDAEKVTSTEARTRLERFRFRVVVQCTLFLWTLRVSRLVMVNSYHGT
ncbi:hypothetical protein DFH05DRAFT_973682 [Lentinula detonsa]|uniref:Uncharacterized protein n=1 Tax=Lentinula detonsa TaxID=2804962 RepID=A0A9W8TZH2_9AGAR|nr:hypothetical protein DFH05DRAFT_973682 [Lentinula detonsa]